MKLTEVFGLLIFKLLIGTITCQEFNRTTTGVEFSAYVKINENKAGIPGWKTYTMQDMITMMEVISTKFSRVATYGVGADNVPYEYNKTYHESNAQVMTAEAAALINAKRRNHSFTVLLGMWQSDIRQQMESELFVALESAEVANRIYPGTVEGILFSHHEIGTELSRAKQTLEWLQIARTEMQRGGVSLRLGSRQKCYKLSSEQPDLDTNDGKLLAVRQKIVNVSDFIICEADPADHNVQSGPKNGFITVGNDLLNFRKDLKKINPWIEVMGSTKWASKGDHPWENINNLRDYWIEADRWASKHNFHIWLLEAFDTPWKTWSKREAHFGWWRLKSNKDINKKEGFAEKIYDPPEVAAPEPGTSAWVYVGIALGVCVASSIILLVIMLYVRVNKLQAALTKDDIREFMYGVSDEAAAQEGANGVFDNALKFPYDKSYELSKDKLRIQKQDILGSGQFGCVYKALIEDDEKTEVALKTAKHDCPKSALKGLLSEIKILTYLGKHPNIVSILGAYTAELENGIVYVATELCSLGSLEGYLRNSQTGVNNDRYANAPALQTDENGYVNQVMKREITLKEMLRWSHEIACGMEFLGVKHVVHADLATRNVLLSMDRTAKITDFGLSRRLYDYTNYVKQQQEPLPWRWMAIESLKRLEFSSKSDVWSYGVTVWEIFALGDLPYPGLSWNLDFVDSLVNGLRMKIPPHATPEIYQIMVDCWHLDPKDRPTFTDLKLSTADLLSKRYNHNDKN